MTNRPPLLHPLIDGCPPRWASGWGQDQYGIFVEFSIADQQGDVVTQRMRWLPAGKFKMGSPENEAGRFDAEGPQHEVTIRQSFWLFDTPCTQALWKAVMGENPSRFVDPRRPVEQVSWDDCQPFLERLNDRVPGLDLSLPSEAQWEYTCRAGTTTATYIGEMEILGQLNAPILDSIAWYGGNSGHEFDLKEGSDSSDWPEKQYPHTRAGTRQLGLKKPNRWGLHDVLGNVWEWCLDGRRQYTSDAVSDPLGPTDKGASRVVRGGSWRVNAMYVRSAYRDQFSPDDAYDSIGFRCARIQETSQFGGGE